METLHNFIEAENERLREKYASSDDQKMVLVQTVKLSEETGELADQILARDSLQREEKLAVAEQTRVEDEIADVLITARLLAESVGVDVDAALDRKMAEIEARYE
jgi:NTP pyrophosphatase (non-canonical NTP hydrolase)